MTTTPPIRVQLSRTKGWRMPENTVKVDRTTKWGNPWSIKGVRVWLLAQGIADNFTNAARAENCVYNYKLWMVDGIPSGGHYSTDRQFLLSKIHDLRGKNLACWCALDAPCHADVLLEMANGDAA